MQQQASLSGCSKTLEDLEGFLQVTLRRGIGVGVKGVAGSDAIVAQ